MMDKVLIMLACYNGECYLRQQIQSIINQTYKEWELIIRDDGSTDATENIIRYYAEQYTNIHILRDDTVSKHGAYYNYFCLIKYAKANISRYAFFMFCDQDDIWHKEKITVFIEKYRERKRNVPTLLYADMQTIDAHSKLLLKSMNQEMGIEYIQRYSIFFAHAFLWGCNIFFDAQLLKIVNLPDLNGEWTGKLSHDSYIGNYASIYGNIEYIDRCLVSYRRHDENVTDSHELKLNMGIILKKFVFGFKQLIKTHALVYNQSLLTIQYMLQTDKNNIELIALRNVIEAGGIKACLFCIRNRIFRKQISRTIAFYLILSLKLYKKYLEF